MSYQYFARAMLCSRRLWAGLIIQFCFLAYGPMKGGSRQLGALIDAVIDRHAAASDLRAEVHRSGRSIYQLLEDVLSELGDETSILSRNRHVQTRFPW